MSGLAGRVRSRLRREWLGRLSLGALQSRLARRRGVLTLCYHTLASDLPDYRWRTAAAAFDGHLAFLREIFDILDSDAAVGLLRQGGLADRDRPVAVVCFDDGYRDNWAEATPILERREVPATLFAARDLVRRGGATHMDERELAALASHPLWRVGAHAVTHNVLTGYRPADQEAEMRDCRDWLADLLGSPPACFAYPQGQLSAGLVAMARRYFDHAFATDRRLGDTFDDFQIRRYCPVDEDDDIRVFARALVTAPMECR